MSRSLSDLPPARRASPSPSPPPRPWCTSSWRPATRRRLLKLQRELQAVKLLIVDELGYVPLSPTGAELLFEVFSQRYERGSTIITSNLPFEDWTPVLGSERLTGALLDRLTHHVHILTMNGDSYRLKQSAGRRRAASAGAEQNQATPRPSIPETGEITRPLIRNRPTTDKGPRSGPFPCRRLSTSLACFYSAPLAWNCSAVDILVGARLRLPADRHALPGDDLGRPTLRPTPLTQAVRRPRRRSVSDMARQTRSRTRPPAAPRPDAPTSSP